MEVTVEQILAFCLGMFCLLFAAPLFVVFILVPVIRYLRSRS